MTTTTATTATPAPAPSAASAATTKLTSDFNTFLKLLTAQLQNQDPLKPTDSSQFTQQLATYSQVEQSVASNKNLETLISEIKATGLSAATNYIGQTVDANVDTIQSDGSGGSFNYNLGADASTSTLRIQTPNGQVVRTLQGSIDRGTHVVAWDGTDGNGVSLPAGSYQLVVDAKDANGSNVKSSISISGKVSAVDDGPSGLTVLIGNTPVKVSQITRVAQK